MRIILFLFALLCGLTTILARSLSWRNYGWNHKSSIPPYWSNYQDDYSLELPPEDYWQDYGFDHGLALPNNYYGYGKERITWRTAGSGDDITNEENTNERKEENSSNDREDADDVTKSSEETINSTNSELTNYNSDSKDEDDINENNIKELLSSISLFSTADEIKHNYDYIFDKSKSSKKTYKSTDSEPTNDDNASRDEDDSNELLELFYRMVDVNKASEEIINNNKSTNNNNYNKQEDSNAKYIEELSNSNDKDDSVDHLFDVPMSSNETNTSTDSEPTKDENGSKVDDDSDEKDTEDLVDIMMALINDDVTEFTDNHTMDITKPTNDDNDSQGDEDDINEKDIEELFSLIKSLSNNEMISDDAKKSSKNTDDSEAANGDNDSIDQEDGISDKEAEELMNLILSLSKDSYEIKSNDYHTNDVAMSSKQTRIDSGPANEDNDSKYQYENNNEKEVEEVADIISLSSVKEVKSNNDEMNEVTISSEESKNYENQNDNIKINNDIDYSQQKNDDNNKDNGNNNDGGNTNDNDNNNDDQHYNNNDDEFSMTFMPLNEGNLKTLEKYKYIINNPATSQSINIPQSYYGSTIIKSINNEDEIKNPNYEFELIKPKVQEQQQTWDLQTLDNEIVIDKENGNNVKKSTSNFVPYITQQPRDILSSKINDNIVDFVKTRTDLNDLTANLQKQEVDLNMDFWRVIGDNQDEYMNNFERDINEVSSTLDKLKRNTVELQNMQQKLYINNLLKAIKEKNLAVADNK